MRPWLDMKTLRAFARRDWAVRRSYQFEFVFRFAGVALSLIPFFYISRLVGDNSEIEAFGGYFEFALIGLIVNSGTAVSLTALNNSFAGERSDGTFEILLATPARLSAILLGSMIIPIVLFFANATLMLGVGVLFGLRFNILSLTIAIPVLLLTMASFMAMGGFSAAVTVLTKRGDPFTGLIVQGSNLLAGTLFPVVLLPSGLQVAAHFVPTFYGLNALRAVILEGAGIATILDEVGILLAFTAVLFPLALLALSRALRIARVTGTLGNY